MPQRAPAGLGKAGRALWRTMTADLRYRPDELRVLRDAAKLADRVESLEKALEGQEFVVYGSMRQPVAHPLLAEHRQSVSALSALLRQLKLSNDMFEDDEEDAEPTLGDGLYIVPEKQHGPRGPMSRTDVARNAAKTRWSRDA